MFHVKQVSREWWGGWMDGWGVDMRLAASLACSCVARALVSPARDVEHIEAGMHRMMVGSRDESPETSFGLRRKFRLTETYCA